MSIENSPADKKRLHVIIKSSLGLFGSDQQLGENFMRSEYSSVLFGRNGNESGWKGDSGGP